MRVLLFVPPMLQLIIFGFAVNLDVENARIAWMDRDQTQESRDLLAGFQGSRYFNIVAAPSTESEMQGLLDRGDVLAVIRVMPGFSRDIQRGDTTAVQVLIDGTNSNTGSIVANYANQVVLSFASRVTASQQRSRQMARVAMSGVDRPVNMDLPRIKVQSRVWFNPELRSRFYFVPGVVVNIIALVTLMLTALAIVREIEIGTMEQLMVTPIRPIELMIGKTLPFAIVGFAEVIFITTMALLVFRIPFRGSFLMLFGSAGLFLLTTLGAGLFISTISRTQQQAMMSSFFFFSPAFMLSGFAFPIRNMPLPAQYLTYLNPVRYFMEIVRGVFLKGTGPETLWPQMVSLAVFGVAVLGFSALRFHKRLD